MKNPDLIAPLVFVASSILIGLGTLVSSRHLATRDKARLRAAAAELGLEFHDSADNVEVPPGMQGAEARELFGKLPSALRGFLATMAPWRITGLYEGIEVAIYPERRSTGRSQATYTIMRAYYREPLPYKTI